VKKRCSGSDVNECVKGREEAGDLVGQGMVFPGGVGWMGFAVTREEELGAGQVYPGQGVGVESVTSTGEGTYTPGHVAHKEDTGR